MPKRKAEDGKSDFRPIGHHFSFTINNCDIMFMSGLSQPDIGKNYAIKYSVEKGTHQHLQGYLYNRNVKTYKATLEWLRKIFKTPEGEGINLKDCSDESVENPRVYIQNVYAYMGTHKPTHLFGPFKLNDEIIPEFVKMKGYVPLPQELGILKRQRTGKCKEVIIVSGPPGTGKSHYLGKMFAEYLYHGIYRVPGKAKNQNGRWFGEGYTDQECIIIDEFHPDHFDEDYLKMMLDRGDSEIATSAGGRSVKITADYIWLFTNLEFKILKGWWNRSPAFHTRIRAVWTQFQLFDQKLLDLCSPQTKWL